MKQKIMYIWSVLLAMFMMTAIISCTDDGDGYVVPSVTYTAKSMEGEKK